MEETCDGSTKDNVIVHKKLDSLTEKVDRDIKFMFNEKKGIAYKYERLDAKNRGQMQALLQCQERLKEIQGDIAKCKVYLTDDGKAIKGLLNSRSKLEDGIGGIESKLTEIGDKYDDISGLINCLENSTKRQEDEIRRLKTAMDGQGSKEQHQANSFNRDSIRVVLQMNHDVQSNTDNIGKIHNEFELLINENRNKDERIKQLEKENKKLKNDFDAISCISKADAKELQEMARNYSKQNKEKKKRSVFQRLIRCVVGGDDGMSVSFA